MERIGHRGAKRELPENTLGAFLRAFERGADAIELDVHSTRDGVVIVHHDPSLHDATGRLVTIADADWAEIEPIRFASGEGIPRLDEVLDAAPTGATVYVEIKGKAIEHAVARVLRETRAAFAVHSFDHDAVETMKRIAPEIPRGILFEGSADSLLAAMERTSARDVWPNWKLIDAALVQAVHAAGGRVIAWTVNDRVVAERLALLGVDGLCGDDVRLFQGIAG